MTAGGDAGIALCGGLGIGVVFPGCGKKIPAGIFGGFSQKILGRFQGVTKFDTEILHFVNFSALIRCG
jgi:hypothetical protein